MLRIFYTCESVRENTHDSVPVCEPVYSLAVRSLRMFPHLMFLLWLLTLS